MTTIPRLIACIFMAGIILSAAEIKPSAQQPVRICTDDGVGAPFAVTQGKALATQMFAEIGVSLEWYRDKRHCNVPPFLFILLSTGAPDQQFPDALAYSRLSDGVHIEVFYNRIVNMVSPRRVPTVLGHTLAHEIAHMLEGLGRHTEHGVMKAHWDARDFDQMSYQPMSFASEDAELIRRGVAQRAMASRLLAKGDTKANK